MKGKLLLSLALLLLATAALFASTSKPSTVAPPPGISAEQWHTLSPTLGLILPAQVPAAQPGQPFPRVNGTLVANINGRWVVVDLPTDTGWHLLN